MNVANAGQLANGDENSANRDPVALPDPCVDEEEELDGHKVLFCQII